MAEMKVEITLIVRHLLPNISTHLDLFSSGSVTISALPTWVLFMGPSDSRDADDASRHVSMTSSLLAITSCVLNADDASRDVSMTSSWFDFTSGVLNDDDCNRNSGNVAEKKRMMQS